jgi:nitroreductase
MADNYLENRMEELKASRPKIVRNHTSLDTLLKRNRSFRGYDSAVPVTREMLLEMVSVATLVPSGMNAQALRFRLVDSTEAHLIHPLIKLGAALPEEHLPHPGEEPQGYIVICGARPEDKVLDIDLGIAAQSILLKAVDMGLSGIVILNFNAARVKEALKLHLEPLAVIGLGKGTERIFLMPAHQGDSLKYYRKDGVHYVPKLVIEDLVL